jgi:Ca2+-binding EF-hand superfamily protein
LKSDKKKVGWIDVVSFSEVMQVLKMELANDDLKLVCEKYDPNDRGRISYHNFCDDVEGSASQVEMDLTMLILEMYQIIRVKFTTLDSYFAKYDKQKKGSVLLQDLSKFLSDFNISPSSSIL